ncbi:MAG: hypothetical protein ABIG44_13300 [Planctomycetota bacterium]
MRRNLNPVRWRSLWLVVMVFGVLALCGCDEELRTTIEDGVIDTSSSLLGAFLQALIGLAGETTTTTTQLLMDSNILQCA